MQGLLSRVRNRELVLLTAIVVTAVTLGWFVARDFRHAAENAGQLYQRLANGLDLIDELQFNTQEVRRIVLYALHTSDANQQLAYAEQSREVDAYVQKLLDDASEVMTAPRTRDLLGAVGHNWQHYLVVRDEVIGLILEGSLREGVELDEQQGNADFRDVHEAIVTLKASFESDAALKVDEARLTAVRATWRLTLLVGSALLAAALGVGLVNRRAVLEGLLRSEAHKGSILQAVPDPIISTDASGRIIELNEAAEHAFGLERREALGQPLEQTVLPEAARGALAPVFAVAPDAPHTLLPRIQTTGVRRDRTSFPLQVAAAAHTAGRDRIWTFHLSDMTAQRMNEAELRRAKVAAEAADRAKGDFLATMSHELRTPLNAVIGIADLLQLSRLAAPQRELVRMLRSSATALHGLVGDVLDYTRIEAGLTNLVPTLFSTRVCVEDALDAVTEPAARKGLEIGYRIDPDVPDAVVADEGRVRQVLLNLLSNGVKFTDAGQIVVHVSATRLADQAVTITFAVRDTGIGIAGPDQGKLFRQFSQVDSSPTRPHRGAGLGLAISDRLSRLLGGALRVESEPGQGSTFTFDIAARLPTDPPPDAEADPFAGVRVLAFLDGIVVGEQVAGLLRFWGADARVVAGDEHDAAAAAADLILADADAQGGRLHRLAIDRAAPTAAPLVLVRRVFPAPVHPPEHGELVVTKPVRRENLREVISAAIGRTDRAPQWSPVETRDRSPDGGGIAVLIAEDDDANRQVLRLMLAELGVEADEAVTGLEAVEHAERRRYDLILMDVEMPGLDGLDATRRIRAVQSDPPPAIIALTAGAIAADRVRCQAAGMDDYLPKPIRLERLSSLLRRLNERAAGASTRSPSALRLPPSPKG